MNNKRQIHIATKPETDVEQVLSLLAELKNQFGLFDNTHESYCVGQLISLVKREASGFGLGARVHGKQIIIDLNPRDRGKEYCELEQLLVERVEAMFGIRSSFPSPEEFVPIERLPVPEAARAEMLRKIRESRAKGEI